MSSLFHKKSSLFYCILIRWGRSRGPPSSVLVMFTSCFHRMFHFSTLPMWFRDFLFYCFVFECILQFVSFSSWAFLMTIMTRAPAELTQILRFKLQKSFNKVSCCEVSSTVFIPMYFVSGTVEKCTQLK